MALSNPNFPISRGPHGRGDDGAGLGDGDDEDDRQACQHHQPARLLHAGRAALRHRGVRARREPARLPAEPPPGEQVGAQLNKLLKIYESYG